MRTHRATNTVPPAVAGQGRGLTLGIRQQFIVAIAAEQAVGGAPAARSPGVEAFRGRDEKVRRPPACGPSLPGRF